MHRGLSLASITITLIWKDGSRGTVRRCCVTGLVSMEQKPVGGWRDQTDKTSSKNKCLLAFRLSSCHSSDTAKQLSRSTSTKWGTDHCVLSCLCFCFCLKHLSLRDQGPLVKSYAPVANMLLLISSNAKFHPVSGLRKVLFQLHKLEAKTVSFLMPVQHLENMI